MNLYPETNLNQSNLGWIISEIKSLQDQISNGGVQVVSYAADMTDHSVIYVYIGSEAGMSNDHWYYWDTLNSVWVDGGSWGGASITLPLAISDGGTGATSASAARTALGITPANIGAVATSSLPLTIANGGTGANTKAGARSALEITPANIGAVSTTDTIPINRGGTGATSALNARNALGITPANIGAVATSDLPLSVANGGTGESTLANAKAAFSIADIKGMDYFNVAGGGTTTLVIANGTHGIVICAGNSSTIRDIVIFNATNAGAVSYTSVLSPSRLSYTSSTNALNVANTESTYCFMFKITF